MGAKEPKSEQLRRARESVERGKDIVLRSYRHTGKPVSMEELVKIMRRYWRPYCEYYFWDNIND